jgi:hypothetical protein
MTKYRDHIGIVIDEFNGLYDRDDKDHTPLDHFQECENIRFLPGTSFKTRDGVGISQDVAVPLANVRRIYNYPTNLGNTLIVLTYLSGVGKIYHVKDSTTVYGPLLTITGMTDFAFVPYGGRAYISPFSDFTLGDLTIQKGLQNEFLYVYAGDGTAARKAAGSAMSGALAVANGAAGHTDPGLHIFGFVRETISGYLSAPGQLTSFTTAAASSVSFGTVQATGSPLISKRYLVATKAITLPWDGNLTGHTFYFVPNATINNDTDNFLNNISFYDADLLDDASHLLDNYAEIPAGAVLSLYRNRLCLATTYTDISTILVSSPGEPEAIDQTVGLIEVPPDGNPITNMQDLRDTLYVTKRSRTVSYVDTGDDPINWPLVIIDNALGSSVHGIATVLDSGSNSVDYLIICTYQGISLFNGRYVTPELSWKVESYWKRLDRDDFGKIQIVNAVIQKELYIVLPNGKVLVGNYANAMDPKKMRWVPWTFSVNVNSVAIHNVDEIVLGADTAA